MSPEMRPKRFVTFENRAPGDLQVPGNNLCSISLTIDFSLVVLQLLSRQVMFELQRCCSSSRRE